MMSNFKNTPDSDTDKATTKQKDMIEHNKRFLNTKLDEHELETINKVEASEMIKEIIINRERYYTEMVDFFVVSKT